ncbi:hypothetical protein POM88_033258 [Heracleum sosnowskyi]|uniref:Uncharacterized protein n=1 Tax=Heracleum sosnowskyi TaxID=360622 RepID=A0AAD8I3U4_9APIA|nr:hypothetical protein POM88_033258 [Heracleum sosnowskyi]
MNLQGELTYLQAHLATLEGPTPPPAPPPQQLLGGLPLSISDLPAPSCMPASYDLSSLFDPMMQQPWTMQQPPRSVLDPRQFGSGGIRAPVDMLPVVSGGGDFQDLARELFQRHDSPQHPCSDPSMFESVLFPICGYVRHATNQDACLYDDNEKQDTCGLAFSKLHGQIHLSSVIPPAPSSHAKLHLLNSYLSSVIPPAPSSLAKLHLLNSSIITDSTCTVLPCEATFTSVKRGGSYGISYLLLLNITGRSFGNFRNTGTFSATSSSTRTTTPAHETTRLHFQLLPPPIPLHQKLEMYIPLTVLWFLIFLHVQDTNYRYVRPLFAQEKTKAHVTTHSFLFEASASDSDPFAPESFKAIFTSGFRYSDGSKPSVKDIQEVSRASGSWSC